MIPWLKRHFSFLEEQMDVVMREWIVAPRMSLGSVIRTFQFRVPLPLADMVGVT
jgi:hypothetical protein